MAENLRRLFRDSFVLKKNFYLFGHCNATDELVNILVRRGRLSGQAWAIYQFEPLQLHTVRFFQTVYFPHGEILWRIKRNNVDDITIMYNAVKDRICQRRSIPSKQLIPSFLFILWTEDGRGEGQGAAYIWYCNSACRPLNQVYKPCSSCRSRSPRW